MTLKFYISALREDMRIVGKPLLLALLLFVLFSLLSGCASPQDNARTLLDRIEFGQDEYGSFEVEGNIDLSSVPFVSATVHVKLEKFKDKPSQVEEVAP